ncbi:MAG: conjugal transfer protein TraB [Deltaproteobacteria bacterium RIFOXYA12_FULL_61_11]|nr:MAG: conjugal transfer protein TraB [Deltaproteobacteria bacterium RIFOXYA12_FULL_61_11]
MTETLPEGRPVTDNPQLHRLQLGERELFLLGTAHVSKRSVDDVREAIEELKPDTVCVELCRQRYEAMIDRERWKKTDIVKVIREHKTHLLLINLVLGAFQRKIAADLDLKPGQEMLQGITSAKEHGAELVLIDRDVNITLARAWNSLSFFSRLKLLANLFGGIFDDQTISEATIEQLKQEDMLGTLLRDMATAFPRLKTALIDERDQYLATKIMQAPGKKILAVIGAGHVPGIKQWLGHPIDVASLEGRGRASRVPKLLGWGIPLVLVAMIASTFLGDQAMGWQQVKAWIVWNGTLSALGALVAWGHPLSILTAFVAAPITSLNPLIAAGWFAGLTEALIRRPTVADFEALPTDTHSVKGFWFNRVTRILLVVVFANLGSAAGTWFAGAEIVSTYLNRG